jgi:hypothetical protein
MRRSWIAVMLVVAASCASDVVGPVTRSDPKQDPPAPALPSPQPVAPVPTSPAVATNAVVLSFLTSGVADTTLRDGVESVVQQFQVYAPCHPLFSTIAAFAIRPVVGCPLPYEVWETELDVAPATVMNAGDSAALLTAPVYSDNGYVYKVQQTIEPGSRAPVVFGSLQLGFICSDGYPMPVTVSLRASGSDLVLIRSTSEVAGVNAPQSSDYPKVWGSKVVLLPIDGTPGVCTVS